jgi:hypothetical protein
MSAHDIPSFPHHQDRECLDHAVVFTEARLLRIRTSYFACYHEDRTDLALDWNTPISRKVAPRQQGKAIAIPQVGKLHHPYNRAA